MKKIIPEIKYDARFIRGHQLQPGWYKTLKVFLLLGILAAYYLIFGAMKTLTFLGCFLVLSLMVHLVYRAQTRKFTQSWLDFVVEEKDGKKIPSRIGVFYYAAVMTNALIAALISQLLGR